MRPDHIRAGAPARNCYCDTLREKAPEFLESRNVPVGYCGFCERCGVPGHMRHAPGAVPYTGSWCDSCYRIVAFRNHAKLAVALVAVVAGFFLIHFARG